jgi:hypothetical protein
MMEVLFKNCEGFKKFHLRDDMGVNILLKNKSILINYNPLNLRNREQMKEYFIE